LQQKPGGLVIARPQFGCRKALRQVHTRRWQRRLQQLQQGIFVAQCSAQGVAPGRVGCVLCLAQGIECLGQSRVGNVALELVHGTGDKMTTFEAELAADVAHQGGLANAGIAHNCYTRTAAQSHLFQAAAEDLQRLFPAIEAAGVAQLSRIIIQRQSEARDMAAAANGQQTLLEIVAQAPGTLVTLLRHFSQQAVYDARHHPGHAGPQLVQGARALRNVGMDPAQGVAGIKGIGSSQQTVQHRTQRVKIGWRIHKAVHAPGAFGRHASQFTVQRVVEQHHGLCFLAAMRQLEATQAGTVGMRIPQNVGR